MTTAVYCRHANEVPSSPWCRCPPVCYCWDHSCREKRKLSKSEERRLDIVAKSRAEKAEAKPTDMGLLASCETAEKELAPTLEILRWAAERPGVLSLLLALKEADYDETAIGYIQRIVSRTGNTGGKLWHVVGLNHAIGEVDYTQMVPPISDGWPAPGAMNGPTVPLEMVVPEWAGQDDFGGEDFACFTGTDEEKGATDALIERQREQREQQIEALKVEAPAFKAEKTWDGRTCAAPDCPDEATGERYVWGMGSLPVCDKHAGTG